MKSSVFLLDTPQLSSGFLACVDAYRSCQILIINTGQIFRARKASLQNYCNHASCLRNFPTLVYVAKGNDYRRFLCITTDEVFTLAKTLPLGFCQSNPTGQRTGQFFIKNRKETLSAWLKKSKGDRLSTKERPKWFCKLVHVLNLTEAHAMFPREWKSPRVAIQGKDIKWLFSIRNHWRSYSIVLRRFWNRGKALHSKSRELIG